MNPLHIMPYGETHRPFRFCVCEPTYSPEVGWIHNALDGRADGKPPDDPTSAEGWIIVEEVLPEVFLQRELEAVIDRYTDEADMLPSQIVGILEFIKHDIITQAEEEALWDEIDLDSDEDGDHPWAK